MNSQNSKSKQLVNILIIYKDLRMNLELSSGERIQAYLWLCAIGLYGWEVMKQEWEQELVKDVVHCCIVYTIEKKSLHRRCQQVLGLLGRIATGRLTGRLALLRNASRRSLSEASLARVRPHQNGEACRSLATVVAFVMLWVERRRKVLCFEFCNSRPIRVRIAELIY